LIHANIVKNRFLGKFLWRAIDLRLVNNSRPTQLCGIIALSKLCRYGALLGRICRSPRFCCCAFWHPTSTLL